MQKKIALVINTGGGNSEKQISDALALRRATLANKVPYCTNMSTAQVCIEGIKSLKKKKYQSYFFARYLDLLYSPVSFKCNVVYLDTPTLFLDLFFSPYHAKSLVRL